MWQAYSLGSLIAGAFESAVDKAGIVRDGGVDSYVASFYRAFFFGVATIAVGFTGLLGELDFFWHWSFLIVAPSIVIGSLLFTYLLRTVEITAIGAIAYVAPFAFLFVDLHIIGTTLSQAQLIGIVLLVCGALAFALDGKTHHFKREFSWKVALALCMIFVVNSGFESYLFKYLHNVYGTSSVSYYASTTILGCALFLVVLAFKGKIRLLFSRESRNYIPYAALGKSFDSLNSILFFSALTFASVSQVSAFSAMQPLIVFLLAMIVQGTFRVRLKEHLDSKRMAWKFSAAVVLVAGGLLVG